MTIDEIRCGEGERLEFKRALSKDDGKWLKTVVAFANGRGGRIVFGVDADFSVVGMGDDLFGSKDAIADAIANRISPLPPVTLGVTTLDGKPVIVLDVAQGMQCPYYLTAKGEVAGVFVRYDATTRQADETTLRELRIEGEGKSFDKTVCRGLKINTDDIAKLCRKMATVARKNAVSNEQRKAVKPVTKTQLVKWGVLVERGGELLPTWAYVLLSGNGRLSPVVKCGVFKGRDRSVFVDRRQFESPIQEQVEKATRYVLEKINMGARFNGVYREDVYEIPPDAIRELIVNAIVHRSYLDGEASPITVALYEDRLEVTSPGGLVRGMTLEKMVGGYSDCRNKAVAAAFAYMNLIENWGSGVKRSVDAIKGAGLREPEFVVWPNAVRVDVYRRTLNGNAANEPNREPDEPNREPNEPNHEPNEPNREPNEPHAGVGVRLLEILREEGELTLDGLAKACGVSRETVKRAIKVLKESGRLRRVGGTRGHWEVVKGTP